MNLIYHLLQAQKYKDKWQKDKSKFKSKTWNKGTTIRTQRIKQKHEMCMTKIQTYLYCNEIKKCKHKKNKIRLWCKIIFHIGVEQTKIMGAYIYLHSFADLVQRSFHVIFYMPTYNKSFSRASSLQVNHKFIKT